MSTSQGVLEDFYVSMEMEMDMDIEQTWQDWIDLEACTPESGASSVSGNDYQRPINDLNCDYSVFIPCVQYADAHSVSELKSWDSSILTFQGSTTLSPVSLSSSLSSISTSPPCSPILSPQFTRNDVNELTSVNTKADVIDISPFRLQFQSVPLPKQSFSKSSRSGKCSSSRRVVPYEIPSPETSSPCVQINRHETPPRRSLRPRGVQKYCEDFPHLSEDDDDSIYTSDSDLGYGFQSSRQRSALSLEPQASILHRIQRDTSLISCPICANDFSRHADVVRHYLSVHYKKSDAEILNDTSSKRLHCLGCTKILSRKDSRERHEAICPVYCAQRGTVPSPFRKNEAQ